MLAEVPYLKGLGLQDLGVSGLGFRAWICAASQLTQTCTAVATACRMVCLWSFMELHAAAELLLKV